MRDAQESKADAALPRERIVRLHRIQGIDDQRSDAPTILGLGVVADDLKHGLDTQHVRARLSMHRFDQVRKCFADGGPMHDRQSQRELRLGVVDLAERRHEQLVERFSRHARCLAGSTANVATGDRFPMQHVQTGYVA